MEKQNNEIANGRDSKGKFSVGNAGRPKGTPNKIKQHIRDKFEQLLEGVGVDQMCKDLMKMQPNERMKIISSLAEFITPKLARTDSNITTTDPVQITFKTTPPKNATNRG